MTLNPENLALIAAAYVAAIGLISWQSPARLFDSLALAALGAAMTKHRLINIALAATYAVASAVFLLDLFLWRT